MSTRAISDICGKCGTGPIDALDSHFCIPRIMGVLSITEDFHIQLTKPLPNKFHRWMQKVFFGFHYEAKK